MTGVAAAIIVGLFIVALSLRDVATAIEKLVAAVRNKS